MMHRSLLVFALAACGSKESTRSSPVTCEVAGQMVSQRMGEYADRAKVAGAKRVELDKAMAETITARCTGDKWDSVPLGCLGAMATVKRDKVDAKAWNNGIDVCTRAIGAENEKKLDAAVGLTVRTVMKK